MEHKQTWTEEYTGDCGDHYCPGHYKRTVKCTCGWENSYRDGASSKVVNRDHDKYRMEQLEKELDQLRTEKILWRKNMLGGPGV